MTPDATGRALVERLKRGAIEAHVASKTLPPQGSLSVMVGDWSATMTDTLDRVQALETALRDAVRVAEFAVPDAGHEGACGPESYCDGICAERAGRLLQIHQWRRVLAPPTGGCHE